MRVRTGREAGIVLLVTLCFTLIVAIGVAAFLHMVKTQLTQVRLQSSSTRAFYAAEAGLERAVRVLSNDLYYTPQGVSPSWADDKVYTASGYIDLTRGGQITVPKYLNTSKPDYEKDFYPLTFEADYSFDEYGAFKSTYQADISNVQGNNHRIWLKATGRYYRRDGGFYGYGLESARKVLVLLEERDVSIWNNAIFAGAGQAGGVINGNANIRGSVHVLGTSLTPNDFAINLSGSAKIGNNYEGMTSVLASRVPSIRTSYGGETVDSLATEVRIKRGKLSLSGSSTVGEPNVPGNGVKETVDGVYITDGYAGTAPGAVYSDNGTSNPYDLEDVAPTFPRLSAAYGGYPSYLDYLRANALVISDPQQLSQMRNILPSSVFDYSNSNGRISMDGSGHMRIEGIVVVEGDVIFGKKGWQNVAEYTGSGTLVSATNVEINCSLLTSGFSTFPSAEIIGVMAANTMTFDEAQINVMGVFYAENQVICMKQTSIAGSICSNYFNMGTNVPSIYQVPEVARNIPKGMVGDKQIWRLRKLTWGEIASGGI